MSSVKFLIYKFIIFSFECKTHTDKIISLHLEKNKKILRKTAYSILSE